MSLNSIVSSSFDEFCKFQDAVFSSISDHEDSFINLACPDKSENYVIKVSGQPIAFYINNKLIKASPFISSAPTLDIDSDEPAVSWPVQLEKPTILLFTAEIADNETDYESLSTFKLSDEVFSKIVRLVSMTISEIFSEVDPDLLFVASIAGVKCGHLFVSAGFSDEEILDIEEDGVIAAFAKAILSSVLSTEKIQSLSN